MDTEGKGGGRHYIIIIILCTIAVSSNGKGQFLTQLPTRVTYHEGSETSGSSLPLCSLVSDGIECFLRKVEAHLYNIIITMT